MSNRNVMGATYITLNFLVATLCTKLKKGKIHLSIFYSTQHTMVSIWNHYKILKILYILFVVLSPSSKLGCILRLQTTSIQKSYGWLVACSFFTGQYSSSYTDFPGSQNTNIALWSLASLRVVLFFEKVLSRFLMAGSFASFPKLSLNITR